MQKNEITLRKGSEIQNRVRAVLNELRIKRGDSVELNEFTEDVAGSLAAGRKKFLAEVADEKQLVAALFEIRKKIGERNAKVGVNEILARVEELKMLADAHEAVARATQAHSVAEIEARFRKASRSDSQYGFRMDSGYFGFFSENELEEAALEVKRLRREAKDAQEELLALNVRMSIQLSDDALEILEKFEIL